MKRNVVKYLHRGTTLCDARVVSSCLGRSRTATTKKKKNWPVEGNASLVVPATLYATCGAGERSGSFWHCHHKASIGVVFDPYGAGLNHVLAGLCS
jgi:hypothetical protein